jgi:hypothetical protein
MEEAARVALGTVLDTLDRGLDAVRLARFVLFADGDLEVHRTVLDELTGS